MYWPMIRIIRTDFLLPDSHRVHMGLLHPAGHPAAHRLQSGISVDGRQQHDVCAAVFAGQHISDGNGMVSALTPLSFIPRSVRGHT